VGASFNATLKNERVRRMVCPTRDKVIRDVEAWIEMTHNQTRLRSVVGYRAPNQFERELLQAATPKAA